MCQDLSKEKNAHSRVKRGASSGSVKNCCPSPLLRGGWKTRQWTSGEGGEGGGEEEERLVKLEGKVGQGGE